MSVPQIVASDREDFNLSGPLHIASVDWTNSHHRRSVAACLVQSVYILERDRQLKREGFQALAPSWWEFFHFQLRQLIVDKENNSIFGAIYQYEPPGFDSDKSTSENPSLVIAFRGTIPKGDSFSRDMKLNLQVLQNRLHQAPCFETAMQAVRNMVASAQGMNIWLAGHSLGAAMGMLAGKMMARSGIYLEAYLFNPPFFSAPIEQIKDQKVQHGIRFAGSLVTAGLAFAMKKNQNRSLVDAGFDALSGWLPRLFVNPRDHICSEYIAYFEHRKKMEEIGAGSIERLATQKSIWGLLMNALGEESDPVHLIPSANVVTNLILAADFKEAHGIHQWWRPDLHLQYKQYKYS